MPRKPALLFLGILIFFSCSFFSPKLICHAASISIKSYPQNIIAGSEFSVDAELQDIFPNIDYYVKSVGGDSNQKVRTYSFSSNDWLAFNGAWADMPKFNIATGSSFTASIKSKFYDDVSGNQNYLLKIQNPAINSDSVQINVIQPTETPAPTNTSSPTSIQIPPSNTPSPSKTPTPYKTPTPKKTPTPTKKVILAKSSKKTSTKSASISKKTTPTGAKKVLGANVFKSPIFGSEIAQILVMIGVLFGVLSVAAYIYQANEKTINNFFQRKFKKE